MFSVYTISRQYGSGGTQFAKKLAELCGYTLIWREIINKAAINIGYPEMALAVIDELGLLGICPDDETCNQYRDSISQVIISEAKKGKVVILGRASHIILKDFPDCLRIRIVASQDTRVGNIQTSKKISEKAAVAQLEESDRNREHFVKKFYNLDWNDPTLYDLTINSDHKDVDKLAQWVLHYQENYV